MGGLLGVCAGRAGQGGLLIPTGTVIVIEAERGKREKYSWIIQSLREINVQEEPRMVYVKT